MEPLPLQMTRSHTIELDFECQNSPLHNRNDNRSSSPLHNRNRRAQSNMQDFEKRTAVHFPIQSSTNFDSPDYTSTIQCHEKERSCKHMTLDQCSAIQNISYILGLYHSWMRSRKAIFKKANDGMYDRIHNKDSKIKNRTQLLNDFHHILDEHATSNRDLETVQKYIQNTASCGTCVLKKGQNTCNIIVRHLRDTTKEQNNRAVTTRCFFGYIDGKEIVTQQILDTIHSFIYHSFDTLRFTAQEQEQIDALCARRNSINDVSCMNADAIKKAQQIIGKKKKMMGLICKYDPYKSNTKFMSNVNDDIDTEEKCAAWVSHLSPLLDGRSHSASTLMSVYSFGKQFIYDKDEFTQTFHLLIKPIYKHFKDELLNNQIHRVSISNYNDTYEKALIAFDTDKAKRLKLSMNHLLSIIFYTDYSVLCERFSQTYRRKTPHEKWSHVAQRHSQYYHWGLLLKESVESFGKVAKGNTHKLRKKNTFYHGLNQELAFTTFVAQFYGPTSFTNQLGVAQSFAKGRGMILSLQPHRKYPSVYFDCKWLSAHPAESEKLFIGGQNPLNIYTIITISNPQTNHRKCLVAMMHISQMIGVESTDVKLKFKTEHEAYVRMLIENELGTVTATHTDIAHKYMFDSFHIFCQSVQHVIVQTNHILLQKMPTLFKSEDGILNFELLKQVFPNAHSLNVSALSIAHSALLLEASTSAFGNDAVEQLESGMLLCLTPHVSSMNSDTHSEEADQVKQELMALVAVYEADGEMIDMITEQNSEEEIAQLNQWYHNDKSGTAEMDNMIRQSDKEKHLEELREKYIDNDTGLGRPNGICKEGRRCGWHRVEEDVFTTLSLAQKLHAYFYHHVECERYEARARSQKYCETHFKKGIRNTLLVATSPPLDPQPDSTLTSNTLPSDVPVASDVTVSDEEPPGFMKQSSIAYTNDIDDKPVVEYVSAMEEMTVCEYDTLQFGHAWEVDMLNAAFGDPKQEILENAFERLEKFQWNNILKQSIRISKKREAKSMRLSVKLVVALKLYTDCHKLQDEFILAYRHEFKHQRIKRQKSFCYWNRLLEESCSRSQDIIVDKLYRGVNQQVTTSSYTGTFWGPVSCTTEFTLANGFVGDEGTILEMYPTYSRRGLKVHWLSMFPYEKEVIYFNTSFQISHIYYKNDSLSPHLMSRPRSLSPTWAIPNRFNFEGDTRGMSQSDFMERAILKSLQLLNTESNVISFSECDHGASSGFNQLDASEKIAVLYLLYLQYRSNKWNEFWNKLDENIKFAFAKYRDQFISLAMNVRAVKMEKLSMWLQDFFCCDQEEYEFPIEGSTKQDMEKATALAEQNFIPYRPLNFGTIVRLFPNAQQLSINGDNFDWTLESFVQFVDQYQLDYQTVALQDVHIKFDNQYPNNHPDELDSDTPILEPGSSHSRSTTMTSNYSWSLTSNSISTLEDVEASRRLNQHKHLSRHNLHQLNKMGWKFMSPSHITRIGFEPLPEMPFVMTFINNEKPMFYRTYSQVLLNKEAFLTMNANDLSSDTQQAQLTTPRAIPPHCLQWNSTTRSNSFYDDEGDVVSAPSSPSLSATSPLFAEWESMPQQQPGFRNRASSYYQLNSSMSKKPHDVRFMDKEKEEKEGVMRSRGMVVDYNPINCTLSSQMFGSLSYKQELIEELRCKIAHPQGGGGKDKVRESFCKYCNMVKALVLDPMPNELQSIFMKDVHKQIPSFEAILSVFPNVCDLFLRDTQLKPKICFALVGYLKQNNKCKLERIFFCKETKQRLVTTHESMVKSTLAEVDWNLNVIEQMIFCEHEVCDNVIRIAL
eukprot:942521_1